MSKAKIFKGKCEAEPEFPEGWGGVETEKPSMGEVWISHIVKTTNGPQKAKYLTKWLEIHQM